MGLFSSIKKAISKVWKGVKKVFKKVGKFVGKILNSKFGKILMGVLTVVTLGTALVAGYGAFAAGMAAPGGSLFGSLVQGGKAFLGSMIGKKAAPDIAKIGAEAGLTQPALDAALAETAGVAATTSPATGMVASGVGVPATTGFVASGAGVPAAAAPATTASPGFLETAKNLAGSVAGVAQKVPATVAQVTGGLDPNLLLMGGNMLSGYATAKSAEKIAEDAEAEKERLRDLWSSYEIQPVANTASTNARALMPDVRPGMLPEYGT